MTPRQKDMMYKLLMGIIFFAVMALIVLIQRLLEL